MKFVFPLAVVLSAAPRAEKAPTPPTPLELAPRKAWFPITSPGFSPLSSFHGMLP